MRVAAWSGPRNISTAMMRSWVNRPDTVVVDEPFYAAFLERTGIDHPGRAEVLAAQPTDPAEVLAGLRAPLAHGVRVHYAKHMSLRDRYMLGRLGRLLRRHVWLAAKRLRREPLAAGGHLAYVAGVLAGVARRGLARVAPSAGNG